MTGQTSRHPGPWPRALLFDLDGTLIDSAPDIAAAVNELLALYGHSPQPLSAVRRMIGNGVDKLVERAFAASGAPLGGAAFGDVMARMMQVYGRHLIGLTRPMPAALDVVAAYAAAEVKMAVVSNKPMPFIETIVTHYGFAPSLSALQGAEPRLAKKPAPDMLLAVLDRLGVPTTSAVMVGDSAADLQAARAAGMPVVLVRGGYSAVPVEELGADRVIDTLADLPEATAQLAGPARDASATIP